MTVYRIITSRLSLTNFESKTFYGRIRGVRPGEKHNSLSARSVKSEQDFLAKLREGDEILAPGV